MNALNTLHLNDTDTMKIATKDDDTDVHYDLIRIQFESKIDPDSYKRTLVETTVFFEADRRAEIAAVLQDAAEKLLARANPSAS